MRRSGFFGEENPSCLLVLGSYVTQVEGSIEQLEAFLSTVNPDNIPWSACCFGKGEHDVLLRAVAKGGHARLGFENNLWLPDGTPAEDNTHLIKHFSDAMEGDKTSATAGQIREAFHLR